MGSSHGKDGRDGMRRLIAAAIIAIDFSPRYGYYIGTFRFDIS